MQSQQLRATKHSQRTRQVEQQKTGAARLLELKQSMFELQDVLEAEKVAFARKEEQFSVREEKLKQKDTDLGDSLVRYSRYLQENDAKRARALKKAADERRACGEKALEAEKLTAQAETLRQELVEAQSIVAKNRRHQRYLEEVVEETDRFQDIGELITRHATLAATNDTLRDQQRAAAEESDQVRAATQAHAKTKADDLLAANTAVPRLKAQVEAVQQEAAALRMKQLAQSLKSSQQTLERGKVLFVASHLFQRCVERSKIAHSSQADVRTQLEVIANLVSDYASILQEQRKGIGDAH